jgi:hypothetical protein
MLRCPLVCLVRSSSTFVTILSCRFALFFSCLLQRPPLTDLILPTAPALVTMIFPTSRARLSRISLFLLVAAAVTPTYASDLFLRQASTCGGNKGLAQCGKDFPSDFCCPKDSACMSLGSGDVQSVICCPSGSDCAYIQPITCDVTQLNATLHPDNQMHLSDTTGIELPTCGSKCCPLGYSCKSGMCSKDPVSSPTPTSSATPAPSASESASASQTSDCPAAVKSERGFDGKSFAAGLLPGLLIGALAAIAIMWFINKRQDARANKRYSGDFGHVSRKISDPIFDPEHAARTDFIRRPSHTSGRPSTTRSPEFTDEMVMSRKPVVGTGLTPRIRSMWHHTPKINFGFSGGESSNPTPPPPAVRAGYGDPYSTPRNPPRRVHSQRQTSRTSHSRQETPQQHLRGAQQDPHQETQQRPGPDRIDSTETIDVLMPAPSFLEVPKARGMRENRLTSDSNTTTFTKLMERAGFDDSGRQEIRNYDTPGKNRV